MGKILIFLFLGERTESERCGPTTIFSLTSINLFIIRKRKKYFNLLRFLEKILKSKVI